MGAQVAERWWMAVQKGVASRRPRWRRSQLWLKLARKKQSVRSSLPPPLPHKCAQLLREFHNQTACVTEALAMPASDDGAAEEHHCRAMAACAELVQLLDAENEALLDVDGHGVEGEEEEKSVDIRAQLLVACQFQRRFASKKAAAAHVLVQTNRT